MTCDHDKAPRWDATMACPTCDGFQPVRAPHVSAQAIAEVARIEAVALKRGWTLGELWNTDGAICAWVLVALLGRYRISAISDSRIALDTRGSTLAMYHKPLAAAVPAERLTARPVHAGNDQERA